MTHTNEDRQHHDDRPDADVVQLRPATGPPLQLGLVGASPLIRAGLEALLEPRAGEVRLVDIADLRLTDVVLVDVHSTDPLGPRHVRELVQEGFVDVWAYGWGSTAEERLRLRRAGARGYLSMRHQGDQVVHVLCQSANRRGEGSPREVPRVRHALELDDLSPRELEVVTLVCRAVTNTEIADEMFISINTVKSTIRSAYRKIGITSRPQCILWGIERGL